MHALARKGGSEWFVDSSIHDGFVPFATMAKNRFLLNQNHMRASLTFIVVPHRSIDPAGAESSQ